MEKNHKAKPHDRNAEEALISAVFTNSDVLYEVIDVNSGDFYIHRNRFVWDAIIALRNSGDPIDMITVADQLKKDSKLDEIGGPAYLTSLFANFQTSANAKKYASIIKHHALSRSLLEAANRVAQVAVNPEVSSSDMISEATGAIGEAVSLVDDNATETSGSVVSRVYDTITELSQMPISERVVGIRTGFLDVDNILRGLKPTSTTLVAGRPGMGKSAFLWQIAAHNAIEENKNVVVFSMEMSNEQNTNRIISQRTGIPLTRIIEGKIREDEWPKLTHAIEEIDRANLFMDDTPSLTPAQLEAKCTKLHMQYGLDLIVVDYIQLMRGMDRKYLDAYAEVSLISRELKKIAQKLHVPVMAAAQLSRKCEERQDKRPLNSDLRDSGQLEQDAENILFLFRPSVYDKEMAQDEINSRLAEVIISKQRDGKTGFADVLFDGPTVSFQNKAPSGIESAPPPPPTQGSW